MVKQIVSFRADPEIKSRIDILATAQKRDRSFIINEALEEYLDLQEWQIKEIEAGCNEADQSKFVDDEQVKETFTYWRQQCA